LKTIAISGKGGTGKSTLAAMMIYWLRENISKSILAVDADCNVNLNELLGVELRSTIGAIREEMKANVNDLPGGMTKQQFLDYKIQSGLIETPDFDLIAMGCSEGPGCYCYANSLLRDILTSLARNYEFIVVDNGAGMEHLSRRTTQNIDYLIMVSDPIVRGIKAAGKISRLVKDLETRVNEKYLVLSRVNDIIHPSVIECIREEGLQLIGTIPEDNFLLASDHQGNAIWPVIKDSYAFKELEKIMIKLNLRTV
jgi:CO dehydrogenase maturation factor